MNYLKLFKKTKTKYEFVLKDENFKLASEILKDIKKAEIIIDNYLRLGIIFCF